MSVLPTALYNAAQSRELDREVTGKLGIAGVELLERAGAAAWEALNDHWPPARSIAVVCGAGNNGGDGYVLARLARAAGRKVRVLACTPPADLRGDAAVAARDAQLEIEPFAPAGLEGADLIVDAVFGTGLARPVEGLQRLAIEAINAAGAPVFAIDIPSGLSADTGAVLGAAVRAAATVTFIGLKPGLFTGAGPECAGRIEFRDLGAPASAYAAIRAAARRVDLDALEALLPRRPRNAHKGDFGRVLVVGGDYGYAGAARMAAEAAARAGTGLVTVATRPEHAALIPAARPELMARGIAKANDLAPLLEAADVIAVGPGLGRSDWSQRLFAKVIESSRPLVMDADALNLLAAEPAQSDRWILTPHPGEAARLLGTDPATIQADRLRAAKELRDSFGGVVVLKGAGTAIVAADEVPAICSDGNPGMASGGMGDVLTGLIAGLLAQRFAPADAARLGVCLHARAADRAAAEGGERGLLAGDLMPWIRRLANPEA
jgi:NAD(P)H-hydrate epimerase